MPESGRGEEQSALPVTEEALSGHGRLLWGQRGWQTLTWLSGVEVFSPGDLVMEEAIARTNIHLVDVG